MVFNNLRGLGSIISAISSSPYIGFVESLSDQSLFSYSREGIKAFFLVYVDNIILASSSKEFTRSFTSQLSNEFPVKDIGDLRYFLGIHVTKSNDGSLLLSQHQYLANLLHSTKMDNLKPSPTPMEPKGGLHDDLPELDASTATTF